MPLVRESLLRAELVPGELFTRHLETPDICRRLPFHPLIADQPWAVCKIRRCRAHSTGAAGAKRKELGAPLSSLVDRGKLGITKRDPYVLWPRDEGYPPAGAIGLRQHGRDWHATHGVCERRSRPQSMGPLRRGPGLIQSRGDWPHALLNFLLKDTAIFRAFPCGSIR